MFREMIDSAYPLGAAPPGGWRDIILIYAGGDTPHPWTTAEILRMPARYRWPCWVRSNPGSVNVATDAANCVAWLRGHNVPTGTSVILDLETAVNTGYVNAFNLALRAAGYKVTKYGSESSIWLNPQTDGGTFVAQPGADAMTTVGDTVARQWGFEGAYDLSIVDDQSTLALWDTQPAPPPPPPPPPPPAGKATQPTIVTGTARYTNATITWSGQKNVTGYWVDLIDNATGIHLGQHIVTALPLPATATGHTFRHLEENHSYKLGVYARPGVTGSHSQWVNVTTK